MNSISTLKASEFGAAYSIECLCHCFPWNRTLFYSNQGRNYRNYKICVADRLVGFCIIHTLFDEAWLYNIAIHPDYQHQGLATRLIRHIQSELSNAGINSLWLEVRVSNRAARALYEQCGFNAVSLRHNYYPCQQGQREDALIMVNPLHAIL